MKRSRRHPAPPSAAHVLDNRPAQFATVAVALTLAALAALLLALPAHAAGRISAKDVRALPVTPASAEHYTLTDTKVALFNLAGTATLEPTTGTQTIVEVTRGGADAGKLKIMPGHAEGRSSLAVIYPGTRIIYPQMGRGSNSGTRVRDDGTFGGKDLGHMISGRSVKISGSGSGTEAHADLTLRIPKGADVLLRLAVGDVHVTNVDSKLMIDTGSGAVTAAGTRGVLDIDTGSGSVRVGDAEGPLSIDTGSGSVDVQQVHGGALMIDTGSGSVSATNIDASTLSIDTGSGDVDVSEVKSRLLHVDTGSGSVSVSLQSLIDDMKIDSGSGRVDVEVPRTTGAMLSLETGSGSIDTDVPLTSVHRDRGELHGQMGDGHGRIVIETGAGGIRFAGR